MNQERTNPISTADLAGREVDHDEKHDHEMPNGTVATEGQARDHDMPNGSATTANRGDMPSGTATAATHSDGVDNRDEALSLIPDDAATDFRDRWSTIQTNFVDEPKDAVHDADGLVAEVIQRVAQRFAEERQTLEGQWSSGGDVSTEDLRQALQHYRSFFQRLLAA